MKLTAFEAAFDRNENAKELSDLTGNNLHEKDADNLFTVFTSLHSFLIKYGNSSYGAGLYRTHTLKSAVKWTALLQGFYPEFRGRIGCFGYDWEGNMVAQRLDEDGSVVMIFEIATGDYFELEQSIEGFHQEDLIDYAEETLHVEKFELAMAELGPELRWQDCIGHKVSLLLGGEDLITNMEVIDLEVYWSIQQQVMDSLNNLPGS